MKWDLSTDVVVVGAGYAGVRAAIAAHDAGASVRVLEKLNHPGGISVMSGGAVVFAEDPAAATRYFTHLSGGRVSPEMVAAFVAGLAGNLKDIERLAQADKASFLVRNRPGIYPFEGREGLNSLIITHVPGFKEFAWYPLTGHYNGAKLMALLLDNLEHRKIPLECATAVQRLILGDKGMIAGIEALSEGKRLKIQVRKGVVLACGGFEYDEWSKLQFLEAKPFYAMGSLASTGDGLRMAQSVGARLWHMWHTHNSYGFKYDEFPMAFRHCVGGSLMTHGALKKVTLMPWVVVDKKGRRFMNEFPPAPQDTSGRPLAYFDPDLPGYPRIPCYLIFDDQGRQKKRIASPLGFPEQFPGGKRYQWSADNSKEIENGWILKAGSLAELAEKIKQMPNNGALMNSDRLEETVSQWNTAVKEGRDEAFNRHPESMMPIETAPFFAMEAWPIVTNTQGGPEHNEKRQVLDAYGGPISRLYTAGELGSFFGNIYELSGNIGECFASGRIAGTAVAEEKPLD